jgi:hypothetical protein
MFQNPREKLLTLAAESEILSLRLARCEEVGPFSKGGVIRYLLYRCGHQDRGFAYTGVDRLPASLSMAIRGVDKANTSSQITGDYGILAGALMGLTRVIRTNLQMME